MSKRIEQYAFDKGYRVTKEGSLLNPNGEVIGTEKDKGYICTTMRFNGSFKRLMAHRLQSFQKHGIKIYENGIVTRHLNGNPLDNSWDNIAIGTYSDNMMDVPKEERVKRAIHAASFCKKYNNDEVINFYENCRSYKKTMENFNISSKGTLNHILKNRVVI